jgi:hypothetical protein
VRISTPPIEEIVEGFVEGFFELRQNVVAFRHTIFLKTKFTAARAVERVKA